MSLARAGWRPGHPRGSTATRLGGHHLADEKKKVAAGKVTEAQYKKDKAKHDKLASQYEADRAELSSDRRR
jgi:hypothetical protein